jgi:hypothetical protein
VIVLSFLLVIVAAVALVVGLVQDSLSWIWGSIASCVLAMVLLGIGVLQRRGAPARATRGSDGAGGDEEDEEDEDEGTAAAPSTDARAAADSAEASQVAARSGAEGAPTGGVAVVPERTAGEARDAIIDAEGDAHEASRSATVVDDQQWAPEPAEQRADPVDDPPAAVADEADAAPTQRTGEGSAEEVAAVGAAAQRAGEGGTVDDTAGAVAIERLRQIRGLGDAKALALIGAFGSLEAIKSASIEDLVAVRGIGESTAEQLKEEL